MTLVAWCGGALPRLFLAVFLLGGGTAAARAYDEVDKTCLARVIYTEARGMMPFSRLMVGYSALRRTALSPRDFGGPTMCGVAFHRTILRSGKVRWQYDGMKGAEPWRPKDERAWEQSLKDADKVLSGSFKPEWPWKEAVYYLDPPNSGVENRCWFERDLVPVGWLGSHLFYREPISEKERQDLKVQDVREECRKRIRVAKK